jgi:hypothetical protein
VLWQLCSAPYLGSAAEPVDEPFVGAAGADGSTEGDRFGHALVHEVHGSLVHERPDGRVRVKRVARGQRFGLGDELAKELVVDPALDHDLAGAEAELALVEERPEGCRSHYVVDVDVVEDDHRVVAAEFQDGALEGPPGPLGQHAGGLDTADQVDGPDLIASEKLICDRSGGAGGVWYDVHDPGWKPGLFGDFGHQQPGRDRRAARRPAIAAQ